MSVTPMRLCGTDLDVVNGARASLNVEHDVLTDADKGLIGRLVRDGHTEPLRGVWAKFRVVCSIKIARQMMTHKRYLAINEWSSRYSEMPEEFVLPPLRKQVGKKMDYQFEPLTPDVHARLTGIVQASYAASYAAYQEILTEGGSHEDAAYVLPMGLQTALIMSGDLYGWLRFLARRAHGHAQLEGQQSAYSIEGHLSTIVPVTLAAWNADGRRAL